VSIHPDLRDLAHRYGVATEYDDSDGNPVPVSGETIVAVLAALGVQADTTESIHFSLYLQWRNHWARPLPACVVTRAGWEVEFWAHLPHGQPIEVHLELEDGTVSHDVWQVDRPVEPVELEGQSIGEAWFAVGAGVPLGYHRIRARSGDHESTAHLIVTPQYVGLPESVRDVKTWGYMTQVYATRSPFSWGMGDLRDLTELATWSARDQKADWVLINPIHAAAPVPEAPASPYSPSSRRFFNPIYLRVEDIPEVAYLSPADAATVAELREQGRALNAEDAIDRPRVWELKSEALELIKAVELSPLRQASFDAFRAEMGEALERYATWSALAEVHGDRWREWPEELHRPDSAAVAQARHELAERVEFHVWLQWLVDEELRALQHEVTEAGMGIGVIHDMAVGVGLDSADSWALQDVLAEGMTMGAPPDFFNQMGQDWALPVWRPDKLAEAGYEPLAQLFRTVLRHAGGIRVDHILGFFRAWWVPEGELPLKGTYVRLDHDAMIGVLALEAVRAGAVTIGEDLGLVQAWVQHYLGERGILGTSILWFEYAYGTEPRPPQEWRRLLLATVTVHDLPPTAGFLEGVHVTLRDRLGLLNRPYEEEEAEDRANRDTWVSYVRSLGMIPDGADEEQVIEGLYRFLLSTNALMVGFNLPDAVGDRRPVNQPGTDKEYPNWKVPLSDSEGNLVDMADIMTSERARRLAQVFMEYARRPA